MHPPSRRYGPAFECRCHEFRRSRHTPGRTAYAVCPNAVDCAPAVHPLPPYRSRTPVALENSMAKHKRSLILLIEDDPDYTLLLQRAFRHTVPVPRLQIVRDASTALKYLAGQGAYAHRDRY